MAVKLHVIMLMFGELDCVTLAIYFMKFQFLYYM